MKLCSRNLLVWGRYNAVSANRIGWVMTFWAAAVNNAFTGNYCGTITVTAWWNNNVITWNQNGAITDGATWTIKVGNLNN